MAKEPTHKPGLHQPVMDTIATIQNAHTNGGGALSLEGTVRLFAPELTAADAALLAARGAIELTPTDATNGTFVNSGQTVKVSRSGITVTVPAQLRGTYESGPENFRLTFDPLHTIEGGMLFVKVKLEQISANSQTLSVNLSGGSFDQYIVHAP